MDEIPTYFSHTFHLLDHLDIDVSLSAPKALDCRGLSKLCRHQEASFRSQSQIPEADAFRFLAEVLQIGQNFEDSSRPFRPFLVDRHHRSLMPEDISDGDLEFLRFLSSKTNNPLIKARIHDILWLRGKANRYKDAQLAAQYYLESGMHVASEVLIRDAAHLFMRGIQLSRIKGISRVVLDSIIEELVNHIRNYSDLTATEDPLPFVMAYMHWRGPFDDEIAKNCQTLGERFANNGRWDRSRDFWEIASALYYRNQQEEEALQCISKCCRDPTAASAIEAPIVWPAPLLPKK